MDNISESKQNESSNNITVDKKDLKQLLLDIRGARPKPGNKSIWWSLIFAIPFSIGIIYGMGYGIWWITGAIVDGIQSTNYYLAIKILVCIFLVIFFILIMMQYTKGTKINYSQELESILDERLKLQSRVEENKKDDVLDSLRLTINQLQEYYTINKTQASNSFSFSLTATLLGFIVILAGVFLLYRTESPIILGALTTISGILSQFIGAAFYLLYRKSINQLNYFYSQLTRNQDTMVSIKLAETLSDKEKQNQIKEFIIKELLNSSQTRTSSIIGSLDFESQNTVDSKTKINDE